MLVLKKFYCLTLTLKNNTRFAVFFLFRSHMDFLCPWGPPLIYQGPPKWPTPIFLEVSFQFLKCSWCYHITRENTTRRRMLCEMSACACMSVNKEKRHMVLKRRGRIGFFASANFREVCRFVFAIHWWFQKLQQVSLLNSVCHLYVTQYAFAFNSSGCYTKNGEYDLRARTWTSYTTRIAKPRPSYLFPLHDAHS